VPSVREKTSFKMSSDNGGSKSADGWRNKRYTIAKLGSQVDVFADTTLAIGEYVGKEFGHEMKILVTQEKETSFSVPVLPENATRQQELMWGKDYDLHLKKKTQYEVQKAKVFMTILGQCDETMRNRVEGQAAMFKKIEEDCDVVALMKAIKECAFNSNDKQYPPRQAAMALKQLVTVHQQEGESLVAYYKRFVEVHERVERLYGEMIPGVIVSKDVGKEKTEVKELKAKNKMLATLFMEGGNRGFKPMLRDLENDFALGASLYPDTPADALQVMMVFETSPIYKAMVKKFRKKKGALDEDDPGYSFMNKGEMMKKGMCFKCGKKGHKAADCTADSTKSNDDEKKDKKDQCHFSWCE
jgi:Zinc knuckle